MRLPATPRTPRVLLLALALLLPAAALAQPTIHVGEPTQSRTAPHVQWVSGFSPENPARVELSTSTVSYAPAEVPEGLTYIETVPRVTLRERPAGPTTVAAQGRTDALRTNPIPLAPSLGFRSLDYDDNTAFTGSASVPPDPDMAVGPNHVLGVVNVSMGAYDKTTGTVSAGLPEQSLQNFFGSATRTFDPKALYDQFDNRYLVVTLERVGNTAGTSAANESRILLASSPTGTVAGTWNAIAIDAKIIDGGNDYWCDYPGFAVDEEAIYVTCNYFGFNPQTFFEVRLFTIDKSALYAGTFNVATDLFLYDPIPAGFFDVTTQPAQPHTDPGGTIGTWMTGFSGLTNGVSEFLQVIRVDNPLASATFTGTFVNVGDICDSGAGVGCGDYADAPQSGAATLLQANDPRTLDAEWRNGFLWTTATINPSGAEQGQATAHWWRVDTATLATVQQGNLGGEDIATGAYTYFPSIAVNDECAIVGFAASSSSTFAGAYYAAIDLTTFLAAPTVTAKAGEGPYAAFDGSPFRWGDYTGTEVDFTSPDDADIWIYNEFADAPDGATNQWATWFARDNCTNALPVELTGFEAVVDGGDVVLSWQTLSESGNAGFEVQRRALDGEFEPLGFVDGQGTTQTPQTYGFRDAAPLAGRYTYRLRQVDLDGSSEFSPEVEAFVGLADAFALGAAYPNPVAGAATITLAVKSAQAVEVALYDALGRQVAVLFSGPLEAEQAVEIAVEAEGLPAGVYVVRAVGETFATSRQLTVVR